MGKFIIIVRPSFKPPFFLPFINRDNLTVISLDTRLSALIKALVIFSFANFPRTNATKVTSIFENSRSDDFHFQCRNERLRVSTSIE